MFSRLVRWYLLPLILSVGVAYPVYSQTLKRKAGFNLNWKFYKGDPGVTAATVGFNDAAWSIVTIPHSASYDSINYDAEKNMYQGTCWYRKSFVIPTSAKRVFIEFEGAMQTADLWVNGDSIGRHINSGYTPFSYEISSHLVRGGNNVLALRLNNVYSADIPPGRTGPDFLLFGGLSRSVWLRFKDSVYIPINGQQI